MSDYIDADFAVVCDKWRPTVTSGSEEDIGDLITLNNFYQGLIYYCMEHIYNFDDVVQAYMKSQNVKE